MPHLSNRFRTLAYNNIRRIIMDFLGTPALAIVAVYLYIELQEWYEKNIEKPR